MPLCRCTCQMDQPKGCRYHREHNFDLSSLEVLARGRVSPDLLRSPTKRHVSSPCNQSNSSFNFEIASPTYKGQPQKPMDLTTTYQRDFCQSAEVGGGLPNGKSV